MTLTPMWALLLLAFWQAAMLSRKYVEFAGALSQATATREAMQVGRWVLSQWWGSPSWNTHDEPLGFGGMHWWPFSFNATVEPAIPTYGHWAPSWDSWGKGGAALLKLAMAATR